MFKIKHIYVAIMLCIVTPVFAADMTQRTPVFTFSSLIGTDDKLVIGPTGALTAEIVTNVITEVKARYSWRNEAGNQLFLDPYVRSLVYPFDAADDELLLGLFGEYRHSLEQQKNVQLRLRAGIERSQDVFNRLTGQVTLHTRSTPSHANQFALRYRYRDQNDAKTFAGYDQHELFVSFQNIWTPRETKIKRVAATVYGDFRQAEADRFDYAELGARLQVKFKPIEDWTVSGRAKVFIREYGNDPASKNDFSRRDKQFSVELNARYNFRKDTYVDGTIGWQTNQSNLASRDVSGVVLRLGYTTVFR